MGLADVIPQVIHQIWKEQTLPPRYQVLSQSWRQAHPNWQWRLWTNADNLAFVAQHYPELLNCYHDYPFWIQRVDMIRYLILHRLGGVYVDLDFECFRSIQPLLQDRDCVLSVEAEEHKRIHQRQLIVSNAFMAAAPGHLLFAAVINDLCCHRSRETVPDRIVLDTTGPMMLTRVLDRIGDDTAVTVLESRHLCPLSMAEADRLRSTPPDAAIAKKLERAFGMHWHDGTWWRALPGAASRQQRRGLFARLRRRLHGLLFRGQP